MILTAEALGVKQTPLDGPTVAEVAPAPIIHAAYGEHETRAAAGPRSDDSWKTPLCYLAAE